MSVKGYKVFNSDWTCRGFQYEVGKTYKHNGNIEVCESGFHFCQKASSCFNYYSFDPANKVAEVNAIGIVKTDGDKSVTDEIIIVREISWQELLTLVNSGNGCTGLNNFGDFNSGSGNFGDCNSGHCNFGDYNSGNWNSGSGNSGSWNSGDHNSGFFNSKTPKVTAFNRPINMTYEEFLSVRGVFVLNQNYKNNFWVRSNDMTDKEKEAHPEHETTGGYLKTVDFKTACKMMWDKLDDEDKQAVREIPNFDPEVFREITGIDVTT